MGKNFSLNSILEVFVDSLFFNSGRTSRLQFFLQSSLFSFFFATIIYIFCLIEIPYGLFMPLILISLYCYFMIMIKRLNDLNHGPMLSILAFFPLLSPFIIIYLTFAKGKDGSNKYGDPIDLNKLKSYNTDLGICVIFFGVTTLLLETLVPFEDSIIQEEFNKTYDEQYEEALEQLQVIESLPISKDDSEIVFSVDE